MSDLTRQRSMLILLLAASEQALETFQAADNPIDRDFVADLERIIERSKRALAAHAADTANPS